MSETFTEWPEPCSLKEALSGEDEGLIPTRRPGRPTKGNEVDHGIDPEFERAQSLMRSSGLVPLANAVERGGVRIEKENTRHRVLMYLFAQGGTIKHIYQQLGGLFDEAGRPLSGSGEYTYSYLVQIRRQPWFQQGVIELLDVKSGDLISAKLELEAMASVETLIDIRDDTAEKGATRLAAANSLLDRHLGKATQRVVTEVSQTVATYENESAALTRRLEQIRQEQSNLNAAIEVETI